jgi:RNA polymerase sigma-70 factor, ECF subfamily
MQQRRSPLASPLPSQVTHPDDLYLCAACARGEQNAHELLEQKYFPALRTALRRLLRRPHQLEDVLQDVRSRLLVGPSPKIATYRGDGSLSGWLRRIAVRAALDHLRALRSRVVHARRFSEFQQTCVANDTSRAGAESHCLAYDSTRVIWQAWSAAVRALEPPQRRLLQQYVVSELSIDVLAVVHSVHRATVARRIARAKKQVREHVLRVLSRHYKGTSGREIETLAFDACRELDIAASLAL